MPPLAMNSGGTATRIRTDQSARVRFGADLVVDTAVGQVEQRAVGSACPDLAGFAIVGKECSVTGVRRRGQSVNRNSTRGFDCSALGDRRRKS